MAWEEARALARFRNQIAHSPLLFGWNSPAEDGPPDFLRIADFGRGQPDTAGGLIQIDEVNHAVDRTAAVAERLRQLYELFHGPTETSGAKPPAPA
jgi:hypothetical protein